MNIEEMIFNGASDEDIQKALDQVKAEKARQEAALRAKQEAEARAKKSKDEKEALKAEARAYAINALIAYSEAFDLLPEGETMNDEDVAELEQLLIRVENMIPLYFKLFQMHDDMDNDLGFGLGGLFK
jgi:molecular chaperone GrpE (heat shock protein)